MFRNLFRIPWDGQPVFAVLRPVATDREAITVHPRTAAALGLSFKGEQVIVHLPLSDEAQAEAKDFLYPEKRKSISYDEMDPIPVWCRERVGELAVSVLAQITVKEIVSWAIKGNVRVLTDLDKLALGTFFGNIKEEEEEPEEDLDE